MEIGNLIKFENIPLKERYFVIDDTILAKIGKKIENASFIFDHNLGRSILGFCIVTLGLFTGKGFYPIDFAYRFGKKRHPKSPGEKIGDPRSISGQRSYEAKHKNKIELALMMIETAFKRGIRAGYVLFDSWYGWPKFINAIRRINNHLHVICRLKDSNVLYEYKGKKKAKEPKWVAFLCTDTTLHASTIIKKYTKRWTIEVCFKECKQLMELGKDQSNDFNAQVFATTATFLRYNFLSFLNEKENYPTMGSLFQQLAEESAVITYAQRLWDFFSGLFRVSFSTIFDLFKIEESSSSYFEALTKVLCASTPIQGCET
jgi:hypothetical protein